VPFDLLDAWDELEERSTLQKVISAICLDQIFSFRLGLHQGGNQAPIYHSSGFVEHLEASRREAELSRVSGIQGAHHSLEGG
jgi:hypothetical protein